MSQFVRMGLLTALSFGSTAAFAGEVAYDWFAMDTGNLWIFDRVENKTDHSVTEIEVTDSEYWGGGWYVSEVAGQHFGTAPLYDHVYYSTMWTEDGTNFGLVYDFGAAVGDDWYFRRGACNAYDVTRTHAADVTGPTGTYTGALARFQFDAHPDANVRCMIRPTEYTTVAKDIGPVLLEGYTHRSDLVFARVRGDIVAQGAGETRLDEKGSLRYTMVLVDDVVDQAEPIQCITTPCITPPAKAHLVLVVENIGQTVITKSFNNGQRYDFDLFDSKGENVRSWSDGQMFTMALGQYVLNPGEHKVYGVIELPLSNYETDDLLYGDFQLVGYELGNIGTPKLSTTLTVQ